jgi:hypothetical protein
MLRRGTAENAAGFDGERKQSTGFHFLQPGDAGEVMSHVPISIQIEHLTASHTIGACRVRQPRYEFGPDGWIGVSSWLRQNLEGHGLQAVTCQDGRCFIELDMTRRLATAHGIIVHGRKVVVDQGIGVEAFDRRGSAQAAHNWHIEKASDFNEKKRAQALSRT